MAEFSVRVGGSGHEALKLVMTNDPPERLQRLGSVVRWSLDCEVRSLRLLDGKGAPRVLALGRLDARLIFGGSQDHGAIEFRPGFVRQLPTLLSMPDGEPDEHRLTLEFDLPATRLDEIEDVRRANGGADLSYRVVGELLLLASGVPFWSSFRIERRIPKSDWAATLEAIRHTAAFQIEFPAGSTPEPQRFTTAVQTFREAQRLHLIGQHRQAVAVCRETLDGITRTLYNLDFTKPAVEQLLAQMRASNAEKFEHVADALAAFRSVLHLAHHTRPNPIEFEPWEARFALEMTAVILNFVGRTIK